jgi:hypothetical protein
MKINGPNDSINNAGSAFPIRDAKQAPTKPKPSPTEPPKKDTVEISAEGRKKAEAALPQSSTLSPERQSEVRAKILEGAYNTADMAGEVAKRILRSGDV